jgi:Fur family peroxide stress response transcriptional regulator
MPVKFHFALGALEQSSLVFFRHFDPVFVCPQPRSSTTQRVYDEVKKVNPTISLATVYKTLQILEQLDMLQELNFPQDQARFDSYMKPHVNLVCLRCGNIRDFDDLTAREIVARIAATAEFTLTGQRLDIYGICKTCRTKAKQSCITSQRSKT